MLVLIIWGAGGAVVLFSSDGFLGILVLCLVVIVIVDIVGGGTGATVVLIRICGFFSVLVTLPILGLEISIEDVRTIGGPVVCSVLISLF